MVFGSFPTQYTLYKSIKGYRAQILVSEDQKINMMYEEISL